MRHIIVRTAIAALFILLSGCASALVQIDTPVELTGEISNPVFTGWYIDYCNGGGLTRVSPNCAQIGGEIYKTTLSGMQPPRSGSPQSLVVAFPAHALSREYHARVHILLVKAPPDFARETGIAYLAREWSDA